MSEPIYLIVSGVYSDWHVEGYCTSKELADQYVANANAKKIWTEPCYSLCVKCVDDMVTEKHVYRKFDFEAYRKGDEWEIYSFLWDEQYVLGRESNSVCDERDTNGKIRLTVYVPRNEEEEYPESTEAEENRATKIAQDMLYKYLYENDVDEATNYGKAGKED